MRASPARSHAGSLFLAAIGVAYAVTAAALLVFAVASTWGFAGAVDRLLQLVLLSCAVFGIGLARAAMKRLREKDPVRRTRVAV